MEKLALKLLKAICLSSDGLQFFQIHRRLYLSPVELSKTLEQLLKAGFIQIDGYSAKATASGYAEALTSSTKHRKKVTNGPWQKIPEEFKAPQTSINQPYAPKISAFRRPTQKL